MNDSFQKGFDDMKNQIEKYLSAQSYESYSETEIDSISFHLTEIGLELDEFKKSFDQILSNDISQDHLQEIIEKFIHWSYHIEEFNKIIK